MTRACITENQWCRKLLNFGGGTKQEQRMAVYMYNWRAGASQPSRFNGRFFSLFIYLYIYIFRALDATIP